MILSPNRSSRGGAKVRLIIIHTAEGATTVQSLGSYFSKSAVQVSSHVGIDDKAIEQYVPYDQMCWSTRSANPISENAELCGFAAWTREQWLRDHKGMLNRTAQWLADRCTANRIPIIKRSPQEVAQGLPGVCGHVDWTIGMKDGTHTDPGNGFPWDVVISTAAGIAMRPVDVPPAPPPQPSQQMMSVGEISMYNRREIAWVGGLTDDKNTPYDLFMFVKRNNVEIHQANLAIQRNSQALASIQQKLASIEAKINTGGKT